MNSKLSEIIDIYSALYISRVSERYNIPENELRDLFNEEEDDPEDLDYEYLSEEDDSEDESELVNEFDPKEYDLEGIELQEYINKLMATREALYKF